MLLLATLRVGHTWRVLLLLLCGAGASPSSWVFLSTDPPILQSRDFLSELECEQLVLLGESNMTGALRASAATDARTGRTSSRAGFRSSHTMVLGPWAASTRKVGRLKQLKQC